jgi:type IV pilus assembly protein PilM
LIHKIWKTIKYMLLPKRTYMGIEITDHAVKIVLLSNISAKPKQDPKLVGYTIEPLADKCMDEGKVVDSLRLLQSIQTAVARLGVSPKKAHFAMPSHTVMVRFLNLPDLPEKDMAKLVSFEMKHNIHLPFDQPVFDFAKMNGQTEGKTKKSRSKKQRMAKQEMVVSRQEAAAAQSDLLFGLTTQSAADTASSDTKSSQLCDVMLVAAPREHVEKFQKIFRASGIRLSSVEIRPLSLFRTIRQFGQMDKRDSFILVDLSRIGSDVSIFHDGQLKITRNVYIHFPIEQEKHDELNENDPLRLLNITGGDNDFIHACGELVHEMERLMNFYRYTLNHRDHEFNKVVISGDVDRMEEIRSFLEERLVREVSIISYEILRFTNPTEVKRMFPSIAVAVGLALRGKHA